MKLAEFIKIFSLDIDVRGVSCYNDLGGIKYYDIRTLMKHYRNIENREYIDQLKKNVSLGNIPSWYLGYYIPEKHYDIKLQFTFFEVDDRLYISKRDYENIKRINGIRSKMDVLSIENQYKMNSKRKQISHFRIPPYLSSNVIDDETFNYHRPNYIDFGNILNK